MTSTGNSTLNNGNKIQNGRQNGSKNKALLELHRIGEERVRSHYDMLDKLASEGDKDVAMFLVNKVLPNSKGARAIKIDVGELNTLEDITKNQTIIFKEVADGHITIDEGEKLFSMIDSRQKTIETTTIAEMISDINERMKKAGI